MKRFTTIALAALMVLTVLASVIPASAATVEKVEIRGPVYNGTNLTDVFTGTPGDFNASNETNLEMNFSNFAGFYYNFNKDQGSETLTILNGSKVGDRKIDKQGLVYEAEIITNVSFEFGDWADIASTTDKNESVYQKIGFLAEEYVPIENDKAAKLSKLLMDEDDTHTIRTGQTLELGDGYAITPQQIDVDGNKVWLELTKNGEYVDDKIINTAGSATVNNKTWFYEQDLAGVDDVETLRIAIDEVFQGQVDSLCVIKGIWQISTDVLEIESDTEIGILEVSSADGNSIVMNNKDDSISLTKDSVVKITDDLLFKVANSNELRFYLMKEYTAPGTYEVRGPAALASTYIGADLNAGMDATTFAGFYYDLKNNLHTEMLAWNTSGTGSRTIDKDQMKYTTTIDTEIKYKFDGWVDIGTTADKDESKYQKIAFFAQEYIPVENNKAAKLSMLLMDEDDTHTIRTGQSFELGDGYAITPQQIDVDGNKVWLELTKNGEYVDDKIINTGSSATVNNKTWFYEQDLAGVDDVETLRIAIDEVFQGQVDSLCVIKGIWQISTDVLEIDSDTEVGILKETESGADKIVMENKDDKITLTKDSTVTIAGDLKMKVAKDDTCRIYPFREMVITGEVVEEVPVEEPVDEVPVDEVPVDEVPVDEVPVDEVPVEVPAAPAVEPEAPEAEVEPPEEEPGFEAIFAIAGLLAVAYLVRRNK